MEWVGGTGPDPIPVGLLDRVMYLGSPTTGRDGSRLAVTTTGPQAHLAVQGAGTEPLAPHFHGVDQFQLFVAGSGTVGGHHVAPGVVHYADRNSVYGPLRPGPEGMAYATLRREHDPGASFMPGARAELAERLRQRPGPRRSFTVELEAAEPVAARDGWRDVIAQADGLRVATCTCPPHAGVAVPVSGTGATGTGASGTDASGTDASGTGEGPAGPGAVAWCAPGTGRATAGDRG